MRSNWSSLLHIQANPFACGAKCAIAPTELSSFLKGKEERSEVTRLRQMLNPSKEATHGSVGSKRSSSAAAPSTKQANLH